MDRGLELVMAVVNDGFAGEVIKYANEICDVRATVIKGRGVSEENKNDTVKTYAEKETVFMVVDKDLRTKIMENICMHLGLDTTAQAKVFALPVTNFTDSCILANVENIDEK